LPPGFGSDIVPARCWKMNRVAFRVYPRISDPVSST